jgi:hypothetical protein
VSDSATAVPAKDTHASVLLSVFSSASALHRTAATRKFPHCCVYSPRWSGAAGARPHCMRPRFQPVTLTMGAEPTTDGTVVPDETLQMGCGAGGVRRVHRELSRSPRAFFPMQVEWRLSRLQAAWRSGRIQVCPAWRGACSSPIHRLRAKRIAEFVPRNGSNVVSGDLSRAVLGSTNAVPCRMPA